MSGKSAKWQKIIIIVFWILLIASFWIITRTQNLSLNELFQLLVNFAKDNPLGMGALFLAFLVRPILLLPSTVLAVSTGYLYGPVFGFLFSTVATVVAMIISYYIAGYFRSGSQQNSEQSEESTKILGAKFIKQFQQNTFESTLIARLVFMPGDLVNFAAGFFKVNLPAFLLASVIGGAPGGIMAVLAGASIEGDFDAGNINIRFSYLIAASLIFLGSLVLSRIIRRRRDKALT